MKRRTDGQRAHAPRSDETPRASRLEWDTPPAFENEGQWDDALAGGHGGDFGGGRRGRSSAPRDEVKLEAPERGGGWDDDEAYDVAADEDDEETEFESEYDDAPRASASWNRPDTSGARPPDQRHEFAWSVENRQPDVERPAPRRETARSAPRGNSRNRKPSAPVQGRARDATRRGPPKRRR